jgi:hypothetical protein
MTVWSRNDERDWRCGNNDWDGKEEAKKGDMRGREE